jgi:hypothetical protein
MNTFHFNEKLIIRSAKTASKAAIAKATAYLWKTAKNSIRSKAGRNVKNELKVLSVQEYKKKGASFEWETKPGMSVADYLKRHQNIQVVIRDSKRDERNPQTHTKYVRKTPSLPGAAPHSHKAVQPGWTNHWLKKSVRFDKTGTVFVNPSHIDRDRLGRSTSMPRLIEHGGTARAIVKRLIGYTVFSRKYKNGKQKVSFHKAYSRKS